MKLCQHCGNVPFETVKELKELLKELAEFVSTSEGDIGTQEEAISIIRIAVPTTASDKVKYGCYLAYHDDRRIPGDPLTKEAFLAALKDQ